jgi:TrmH family RNA methyltransferase
MTIKIVLVEPSIGGNIGSTARVMKNFGYKDLVLINPQTEFTGETYRFAMNATDILDKTTIYESLKEFSKTVDFIVGTTARICKRGGSTNVRVAVRSDDPSLKKLVEVEGDIALLFGRENYGLSNEEIAFCDMTITIPTEKEYRALNLAQSIGIILYSLNMHKKNGFSTLYHVAKKEDKETLIHWFNKAVHELYSRERKAEILTRRFRNIIGRAFVSGKEANSLIGVFSKTYNLAKKFEERTNRKADNP